jgi:phosphogluconate dehydratase
MSGASGKVPAALHVTPEAADGGMLARLRTGDIIRFDADTGVLEAKVEPSVLMARELSVVVQSQVGFGRELFGHMRAAVSRADAGASVLF